jgi:hypothetical protein
VIAGDTIDAGTGQSCSTEDVAAADYDGNLDAQLDDIADLGRDPVDDRRIDTVILLAQQRFAAELQEDSFIGLISFH